eukprot:m.37374 g.37374  ORF g.37374 m.37374 type:complete len:456 (-) comp5831_c0_seq2:482-1849(-)
MVWPFQAAPESGRGWILKRPRPATATAASGPRIASHTDSDLLKIAQQARNLQRSDIVVEKTLFEQGAWSFQLGMCKVVNARNKLEFLPVGIQSLRADACDSERRYFHREAKLMQKFVNPHILAIGGVVFDSDPYLVVHEPCEHGTLDMWLAGREVELGLIRAFALDVCAGMVYLERNGYVHWDLAARNVFLNSLNICKIGGLGLGKSDEDSAPNGFYTHPSRARLRRWGPPEVGLAESMLRRKSSPEDVWAFGFFLYELFSQAMIPYGNDTWIDDDMYVDTMVEVQEGTLLPQPEGCPDDIYDIMIDCWEVNPRERPTFARLHDRLTSQSAIDELDQILSQAMEATIAASGSSISHDDAVGLSTPSSPVNEHTRRLIEDNTQLREELEELKRRFQSSPEKQAAAPESPRPGRKFKPTGFDSTRGSQRKPTTPQVKPEIVSRFSSLFSAPSPPPRL